MAIFLGDFFYSRV